MQNHNEEFIGIASVLDSLRTSPPVTALTVAEELEVIHWQFEGITRRNSDNTDDEFEPSPHTNIKPSNLGMTGGVWLGGEIAVQVALKLGLHPKTVLKATRGEAPKQAAA